MTQQASDVTCTTKTSLNCDVTQKLLNHTHVVHQEVNPLVSFIAISWRDLAREP